MKSRIITAISTSLLCFSLLASCDILSESIADSLVPPPRLAHLADYISPIRELLFIIPALIGVSHFLLGKNETEKLTDYISSFVMVISSALILSLSLTFGGHFMMLNGEREITIGRYLGNASLLCLCGMFIYVGIKSPNQAG